MTKRTDANLWHRRFGHFDFYGLRYLSSENHVVGMTWIDDNHKICTSCQFDKQLREKFPRSSTNKASEQFKLVLTDVIWTLACT